MKNLLKSAVIGCVALSFQAQAGGSPEFVKLPDGYKESMTRYATGNRANDKQIAKFYANDKAIQGYKKNKTSLPGSVVVMEIYKPKLDSDGNKIVGDAGVYEIKELAAVAVMENRDDWSDKFPKANRVGNWGFAVYKPDGSVKKNDLNCVQCHTPLMNQDYLFSHQKLVDFVANQ